MSTNTAKRPEFLNKLVSTVTPRHEPEVEEAQSLKESRPAMPSPMLDLVFRDGKIRSFNYAYLAEVEFEPGDALTLKFSNGAAVIIEGRGLARHRVQVRQHRAESIQETPENELERGSEEVSQVDRIYITEAD